MFNKNLIPFRIKYVILKIVFAGQLFWQILMDGKQLHNYHRWLPDHNKADLSDRPRSIDSSDLLQCQYNSAEHETQPCYVIKKSQTVRKTSINLKRNTCKRVFHSVLVGSDMVIMSTRPYLKWLTLWCMHNLVSPVYHIADMAHDRASMMVPFTEETETNRESNILGQPTTRKASHLKFIQWEEKIHCFRK